MQGDQQLQDFKEKFKECNDKFETVFKLTSAASKIINSDLIIVKVNKALTELLGYSAEEIEGTKILDYACESDKAHWHNMQDELWTRQVPFFKLQACLYKKDRSVVWVDVTTVLYKDEGKSFGFTVLDDVTGLKQFEASQKRLNFALRYSGTAVWELNLKSNQVVRSEGHDQIFGIAVQVGEWKLEDYYAYIREEDLPDFKSAMRSISAGGSLDIKVRLVTNDSSLKWLNFKGKAEAGEQGDPVKILGLISDITRDKIIERYKDDFISIASHELKTPVTSLKGALQMLDKMKEEVPERLKMMILQSNKSVDRISSLIDDLLNASRVYREQLELNIDKVNLYQLAERCRLQTGNFDSRRIVLSGDSDLEICADEERVERVLINLLNNAVKYAPESQEIRITFEDQGNAVKICVIDQGPGIASEKLPLLFDQYYQDTGSGAKYSGLGLGLFVSAEIIKKHGGKIGVLSEAGLGSSFWFTLPKIEPG
ncbi:MAG: PAS domain-containing sensor histidine kinase [Bacteroidota bacterium]